MYSYIIALAVAVSPAGGITEPLAVTDSLVFNGRENALDVRLPRLDGTVVIDGVLDEITWSRAALLTGFSQYVPVDGMAAADSTDVLVWYDEDAIYFGIRAFEPHGAPVATLADRDRLDGDDHVRILLDTFNDRRRALFFAVNPFGVQADGIWNESASARGGLNSDSGDRQRDLSPDFLFESRGRIVPGGWEAEVRIPFASLRYQADNVQSWGIHIVRVVQHSRHQQTWAPARQAHASFLAQAGTLRDLTGLRRGLVIDANPVVTARSDGARNAVGRWAYDSPAPEVGLNLRWGVSENLTLNATVNPDFSQVESDAGQLSYDPRQALFFPEKRPFFLEASENFVTPSNLIYTRRVVEPVTAAKFTGKLSGTDVGALVAVDDTDHSLSSSHPVYAMLRVRRDLGDNSSAGFVYTDRTDGAFSNRVVAGDARLVFGGIHTISLQGGASFDESAAGSSSGRPVFQFSFARAGREFGLNASLSGTHPEFIARSGFTGRAGIVNASVRPGITRYGAPGATVERWNGDINLSGVWRYQRFMDGEIPDDPKLHFNSTFTLRGGWRIRSSFFLESFSYPEDLYRNYFIDAGTDTLPYIGTPRITNYDFVFNVTTPQFRTTSAYVSLILGRDENFAEWAPGYVWFTTVRGDWRPTDKIRMEGSFDEQRFYRPDDLSLVRRLRLPRVKLEYQLARPLFVRLVSQYNSEEQDDLRDDTRTGLPILLRRADGSFVPASAYRHAGLSFDVLISYQPSPGTVVFAGYGNGLRSVDRTRLDALERFRDGFFVKLSYVFRT
jgi:hypothetical protein